MSVQQIQYTKKGVFTALAIFLAGYLFVILLTYTPNDPSWSHISSDMSRVSNMGGITGAWIADLLYMFFGWFAWFWLIIIGYEATHLWWQRLQPILPLRLITYVFLLFTGSALCAEIGSFIDTYSQAFADKRLAASLHTGGIIGVEVGSHLAHLLTPLGALVFLLLFLMVTLTYVFNIHWLMMLYRLRSLDWLGSGVKANQEISDSHHTDEYQQEVTDERVQLQDVDKYGQMPSSLSTQTSRQHHADHVTEQMIIKDKERCNNKGVLEEFLYNSGLRETIVQFQQQEKEKLQQADIQYASDLAKKHNHNMDRTSATTAMQLDAKLTASKESTTQPSSEKIEPSFAWNNPEVIDDLLASPDSNLVQREEQAADNLKVENSDVKSSTTNLATFVNQKQNEQQSVVANVPPKSQPQNDETMCETMMNDKATLVQEDEQGSLPSSMRRIQIEDNSFGHSAPPQIHSLDSGYVSLNAGTHANIDIPQPVQQQETTDIVMDLTPTNTPPADPTQAPISVVDMATASSLFGAIEDDNTDSSAIQLTVTEASDGHYMTEIEMMADDGDNKEILNLPSIDDDLAFFGRSRAMQTAKYREQLTPIPAISILDKPDPDRKPSYTVAELERLSELLEIKLQEFNVKAQVVKAIPGPVVTRFEVDLAAGVKASKVTGIARDLARSLSMASLRVVEVIPGKPYIGIEVPNKTREMVRLIELLDTDKYKDPKAQISMAMGKDIGGKPIITDLAKAPHMLVAGTTGSGKSVLVNAMLLSILLKYKPDELRLILIDPKQLELANYNDIPHLLTPVVTDMNEAASSLSWCVAEMERRYQLMSLLKVRKLGEFNKKVRAAQQAGKPMIDPLWRPNDSVSIDQAPKLKTLPMIVIVADEFADMIMQVGKQAEELITRLAQKSRAAGIHLMLATQRPSVDVITGLIKANIPVRAALRVNSKVDSRTILDSGGAEDMLGNGDMLFLGPSQIEPDRVHGAYVSDEEVNRVCDAWRERGAPDYIENMASNFELSSPDGNGGITSGEDDNLYDEAVAFVMETRKVSASSIQRKFSIGYNRAARIVDSMEEAGLVSAMGKSGKRELLI